MEWLEKEKVEEREKGSEGRSASLISIIRPQAETERLKRELQSEDMVGEEKRQRC